MNTQYKHRNLPAAKIDLRDSPHSWVKKTKSGSQKLLSFLGLIKDMIPPFFDSFPDFSCTNLTLDSLLNFMAMRRQVANVKRRFDLSTRQSRASRSK
jgi:hypothetical protein